MTNQPDKSILKLSFMEPETINVWSWIIPLLVGITAAFLGYLLGLGKSATSKVMYELRELKEKHTRLEIELANSREKLIPADLPPGNTAIPFNPKAARTAFGKRIKEDDLKLVEGIGPKIEGLFHNYDIKTWYALSKTPVAKCREVLDSGGDRYQVHDPSSWPMQARMAYEGKWKALARWQEEHKRGKL
jgi:predicted flap endonuclease-1-like 5' DNA nuclease